MEEGVSVALAETRLKESVLEFQRLIEIGIAIAPAAKVAPSR
jgi:hypothetical protein